MIAIVGGFGAALSWAVATLASSRSSRMIGPMSVLGWVMAVGLVAAIGPALLASPMDLDLAQVAGLFVLGLCHNSGLLLTYAALSIGRVSIVSPIVATEGALAAVLSILLGDSIAISTALILLAIAVGVVLAAWERPPDEDETTTSAESAANAHRAAQTRKAAVLAIAAAFAFSIGLVLSGKLGSAGVPPAWVIVVTRTVGVVLIALPLIATRRFRLTRAALPLVVLSGILEALGSGIYVVAASADIAVAAVLSSQFAAIAAVGGFLLFRERLQRVQVAGVVTIAVGITVLSALGS